MKFFIKNVLIFFLLLVCLNSIVYIIYYRLDKNKYENYSLKYTSYLFGDSHGAAFGQDINSYNIYNFSSGRDSYFDIERKINFILEKQKIDTIYLSVDDHCLSPYRETANNITKSIFYCRPSDFNSIFEYFYFKHFKHYFTLFDSEIKVTIRKYLFSSMTKNKVSTVTNDWCTFSLSKRIAESNKRYKDQFKDGTKSKKLTLSLLRIIHLCKSRKITLIGVKFPLAKEYLEVIDNKSYFADSILLRKNIPVLDFKENTINDCSDFLNQDHLNYNGAKKLIKEIFN